jgi:uncharacterized MAPEG superfamily protein
MPMTIALWCVFIAGLLPYVATLVAKSGRKNFDNRAPRDWLAAQEGFRKRANAAQMNSFEAFPFFAAAVIVAHVIKSDLALVNAFAVAFIALRLVYLAMYLANRGSLRTIAWFLALGCVVAIWLIVPA